MQNTLNSTISLDNVSQTFTSQQHAIELFKHINLTLEQGRSYAITGPSGAGKSSLLMIMSGLESPTTGQVTYTADKQTGTLTNLTSQIGFIFQQFHLLPELDALNNVALPLKLRGDKYAIDKAKASLADVGLSERFYHKPALLSGGEQQRVAIARALVFRPKFIFADEPTGNLDEQNAADIADLLFSCCHAQQAGLIVVTHSQALAARAQRQFNLNSGKLTHVTKHPLNKECHPC
jgi:putative ABC transport system ATP-binding protein